MTKLVTWKRIIWLAIILVSIVTFTLYRRYKTKGFLDRFDLIACGLPLAIVIAIAVAMAYWANRANGKE